MCIRDRSETVTSDRDMQIILRSVRETIGVVVGEAQAKNSVFGIPIWPGSLPLKPENKELAKNSYWKAVHSMMAILKNDGFFQVSPRVDATHGTAEVDESPKKDPEGRIANAPTKPKTPVPDAAVRVAEEDSTETTQKENDKGHCVPNIVEKDGETSILINGGAKFVPLPGGIPKSHQKKAPKGKDSGQALSLIHI